MTMLWDTSPHELRIVALSTKLWQTAGRAILTHQTEVNRPWRTNVQHLRQRFWAATKNCTKPSIDQMQFCDTIQSTGIKFPRRIKQQISFAQLPKLREDSTKTNNLSLLEAYNYTTSIPFGFLFPSSSSLHHFNSVLRWRHQDRSANPGEDGTRRSIRDDSI